MYKQNIFLFLFILLIFSISFVSATKLVVYDNSSSKQLVSELTKSNNKELKIVSDIEYNLLSKKNMRIIASIDNSKIIPYQVYSVPSINTNYFWSNGFTGSGLKLGLVDSGISYSSDALTGKIYSAYDFTDDSDVECLLDHGCKVSSVMLGKPSLSNTNYKGVAYDANVVSGKIFDHTGSVPGTVDLVSVFDWVVSQGANYINNSWGSPKYSNYPGCLRYDTNADGSSDALIWDYYDYNLYQSGNAVLLIFSSGNEGQCASEKTISNDCSAYNNICVGALNDNDTTNRADDTYATFSSRGPTDDNRKKPDLVAPGQSIYSANYDSWTTWSGTSAASPHVTASAGLLSQLNLSPLEIKTLLINSSNDINSFGWDKYTGWGYVNLQNAYNEHDFVDEYDFNMQNLNLDYNTYSLTIYDNNTNYFYLDSNETAKCTIVWKRIFDNEANPFVQNYDLYIHKDVNTQISNSLIDNVEQVDINNSNSNSYIKVFCNSGCQDINYSISCNLDYNKVDLDYFPLVKDENSFVSNGDGNFIIYFNISTNTMSNIDSNIDYNFDLNIYDDLSSKVIHYSDVNSIIDFNLDLNSDYYPLTDYNISFDFNYYSFDYNEQKQGRSINYLNSIDNIVPQYLDENIFYLSSSIFDHNFVFYDPNVYVLDYNLYDTNISGRVYSSDYNYILYNLDFNADDYNNLGEHILNLNAKDIYGNILDKNIIIYSLYLEPNNYYVDYTNSLLYYNSDLNDLNIQFYYDSSKDFNIYLDSNEFSFSKDNNLFYYDFNLDANYNLIIKDCNRDLNILSLDLVLDNNPVFVTSTITKDFNILVTDFNLNIDLVSVYCDSSPLSTSILQDNNNYYISGSCNSNSGTHTLDVNVFDYANNFSSMQYTYTIVQQSGSGSGGGSSKKKEILPDNNNLIVTKQDPSIADYNYSDYEKLSDSGSVVYTNNTLYILDSNAKILSDYNVKIYDSNRLIFSGNISEFKVKSYAGKELTVIAYAGSNILAKSNLFVPKPLLNRPDIDINNSKLVPFVDSNNFTDVQIKKSNNISIWVVLSIIILLLFIFLFSRIKLNVPKRYNYK